MNIKKKINRERILLTMLVGVSFLAFLLWSIQQSQNEEEASASVIRVNTTNPLKNAMIQIDLPQMNQTIKSPVTISGQANTADKIVKIRIKDQNNLVLATATAKTKEAQKFSPFSIQVKYKKPSVNKGEIEVFEVAPEDNAEIYKICIPVTFQD